MVRQDYLNDLIKCELCEHRCRVNRLAGETGVCRVTRPAVASATLHPAPPESYTVFVAGCNYKCLNCQNWSISQYPDNGMSPTGFIDPKKMAAECIEQLNSPSGRRMRADRIFFSGGEPTIHLPYIEAIVDASRKLEPETKINFDTNGFMTPESLERVLKFTTSITFDLKAYDDEVHQALTGVPARPVQRNAEHIGRHAKDKLWEYRVVVIPKINKQEIKPLSEFIAGIDTALRVCFLAFRPNFVLENHPGAMRTLMNRCVETARNSGLKNAYWAGCPGISGKSIHVDPKITTSYGSWGAKLAATYALHAGCRTHPRDCRSCRSNQNCILKGYIPRRGS